LKTHRFMRSKRLFVIGLLLASAVVAEAGIMREDVAESEYIALANDARYASVGCVFTQVGSSWYGASGVLINDGTPADGSSWILTAAHVLDGSISELRFYLGPGVYGGAYTHRVVADSWLKHPDYNKYVFGWRDIGLIHLSQPITDVTPATLFTGTDVLGTSVTMVGYGNPGTNTTGERPFDGIERGGTNVIDDFTGSAEMSFTFNAPGSGATALEYGGAHGDSGGGVFYDISGQTYLAGIIYGGYPGNAPGACYGVSTCMTRMSWADSWVYSVVPEPGTAVFLTSGMLLLLRRRKFAAT